VTTLQKNNCNVWLQNIVIIVANASSNGDDEKALRVLTTTPTPVAVPPTGNGLAGSNDSGNKTRRKKVVIRKLKKKPLLGPVFPENFVSNVTVPEMTGSIRNPDEKLIKGSGEKPVTFPEWDKGSQDVSNDKTLLKRSDEKEVKMTGDGTTTTATTATSMTTTTPTTATTMAATSTSTTTTTTATTATTTTTTSATTEATMFEDTRCQFYKHFTSVSLRYDKIMSITTLWRMSISIMGWRQ
jgi:hypothetical protein